MGSHWQTLHIIFLYSSQLILSPTLYIIYICIVWYCYGALLRTSPMNTYVKVSFWLWSFTFGGLKLVESRPKKWLAPRFILLLSFSYHFSFFVLVDKSYEKQKYYVIVFHFRLACLALQMENIVQKITQPIFVFGNFVNQNKKWKMGWKAH